MNVESIKILIILLVMVGLFFWGRWRHDVVAFGALLVSVLTGLVPGETAFIGFGHPAVITVACILVLSRGLQTSGAVDILAYYILPKTGFRPLEELFRVRTIAFLGNKGLLPPVRARMLLGWPRSDS